MARRLVIALLGVACAAPALNAQGTSQSAAQQPTPVAARDIARGVELTAADMKDDGAAASRIGWISRRVIHEGEQLVEPAIGPAPLVRAGSEVTVRAEAGGVVVTRAGTALSSGALGDRVRVRIGTQHTVSGIVASSSTVKIQ